MMKKISFFILCLITICTTFSARSEDSPAWPNFKKNTLSHLPEVKGWCPVDKASKMMDLIYATHPTICVEIGVFGGSSIYPTACALKYINQGKIYAIDSWNAEDCLSGYAPTDPNYSWWSQVDLKAILESFVKMLFKFKVRNFCEIMEMKSSEAVSHFKDESIDILHIDGNHSSLAALADAQMFLPKVKKGGYIWFDDANWATTKQAVSFLLGECTLDPSSSLADPYLLFRKES